MCRCRPSSLLALALLAALLVVSPLSASAQEPEVELSEEPAEVERAVNGRFSIRIMTHVAGFFESTASTKPLSNPDNIRVSEPANEEVLPAFGGAIQFEVPIVHYFHLGFQVGAMSWISKPSDDLGLGRNTWIDADLTLRGRYTFLEDLIEIYLLVPVGLTVNRFSESSVAVSGIRWGHAPGFNISTIGGLGFDFGGHGLFVELGWTHRQFFHSSAGRSFGTPVEFALDGVTNQLHVGAGFMFAL